MLVFVDEIDYDIQNKIYYSLSIVLLTSFACCSLYTHRFDNYLWDKYLFCCEILENKMLDNEIIETFRCIDHKYNEIKNDEKCWEKIKLDMIDYKKLKEKFNKLKYFELTAKYIVLLLVVFVSLSLMWMDIIDVELCSYISFAIVFGILLLVYYDLHSFMSKVTEILSDINEELQDTFTNNGYWSSWYFGIALCFSNELQNHLYYIALFGMIICIALCINYFIEITEISIDMCALMFFFFVIMLNCAFCFPQIISVVFMIVFLYMFNFYDYSPIIKVLVLSSCLITNLLIISCVHGKIREIYCLFSLVVSFLVMSLLEFKEIDFTRADLMTYFIICIVIFFIILFRVLYCDFDKYNISNAYEKFVLMEIWNSYGLSNIKTNLFMNCGNKFTQFPLYMLHDHTIIYKLFALIVFSFILYVGNLFFSDLDIISDAFILFSPCICLLFYSYIPGQTVSISVFLFMINVFSICIDSCYSSIISFISLFVIAILILNFYISYI